MKINYNLNKDDYVNFNIYHSQHSDSIKKNLKTQRFITPLIFFIFPFIAKVNTGISFFYWLSIFAVIYILWTIYYPKYYFHTVKKGVGRMIEEGKNHDLLGPKTIELREDDIFSSGENSESKVKWHSAERYIETDQYIFIYISAMEAYIIPKRDFESEDQKESFINILDSKIAN